MRKKRYLWIIVGVGLLLISYYFTLKDFDKEILEHKMGRETTATVRFKEYVKFDETNHSYLQDDGYLIVRQPGDEEWRVYYEIDNLDQISDPIRSQLMESEAARIARGQLRFSLVSKEQYEFIAVGDTLSVTWQWFSDNKIGIISAGKVVSRTTPMPQ